MLSNKITVLPSRQGDRTKPLKVVLVSNWFDNPYKKLLTHSLESHGIQIKEEMRRTFFLPQVLFDGQPDILHLQTLMYLFASRNWGFYWLKFLLFMVQINLLKILGTKTVWTVHEWKDKISQGKHDLSPQKAFLLGKTLTGIITHCNSTKQTMIADLNLSEKKVFVVPHGNYIDSYENSQTQAEARKKLGIPATAVSFLFFGGIHLSKGVPDAIEAFKSLGDRNVHFTIAGQIPNSTLRQDIEAKTFKQPNILLSQPEGGIADREVQIYLNACDVVVMPYRVFTTSGVALLAMSFKKACIAPKQGFFNDILDERGSFLYETQTKAGLAQAMIQAVARRSDLARMGKHNYQLAQGYSWENIARQTIEVYQWAKAQH